MISLPIATHKFIILAGNPNSGKSTLFNYLTGLNQKVGRMPPEDSGGALTAEQIGLLRAWIDQGLVWPDDAASGGIDATAAAKHWSFLASRAFRAYD